MLLIRFSDPRYINANAYFMEEILHVQKISKEKNLLRHPFFSSSCHCLLHLRLLSSQHFCLIWKSTNYCMQYTSYVLLIFFLLSLFTQGCLVPVLPRRVRKKKPFSGLESTIKYLQSRSNNPTVSNYKKIRNRTKTFFNNQYC